MESCEIIIRPIKLSDAEDINKMRRQPGVMENTLGMPSDTIAKSEDFIKNIDDDTHILVAEYNNEIIGIVGLNIFKSPRMRHSASIGISVRKEYQGQGIGKRLMQSILDIADNWLMLLRVELSVYEDNERAINLYKSCGFQIEGLKKMATIRNGEYVNEFLMARFNIPKQFNEGVK